MHVCTKLDMYACIYRHYMSVFSFLSSLSYPMHAYVCHIVHVLHNDGDIDFNDENIFNVSVDSGDQEATTEHGKIAIIWQCIFIIISEIEPAMSNSRKSKHNMQAHKHSAVAPSAKVCSECYNSMYVATYIYVNMC